MGKTTQLALAGLSAIAVAYGFARYGYGLFVPVFKEEFGLSTETVGLISSAGYASYLLAMVLTGFLTEKAGPRFPVVTGAVCGGTGMLLVAVAQGTPMLFIGVVLAGSSPGFCWAPFSDAVAMLVDEARRNRVLSAISTGTTFGLMVAGPVVLLVAGGSGESSWRYGWAVFAGIALLVALWNFRLLPDAPYREDDSDGEVFTGSVGWYLCRRSAPLLGQAFCYGLIAAFYYTYAVDLVRQSGLSETWGPILWSLVGVGGIAGVLSGDSVSRFGLKNSLTVCLGVLAASIVALSFSDGSWLLVITCALVFGTSYMPISALLVVWSGNVFHERPATGFSGVLFALAVGSILGPTLLGAIAGMLGLQKAFWCAAALTALSIALRPNSDIRSTTPDKADMVRQ